MVPSSLQNHWRFPVTRVEFAQMVVRFLGFQYGYAKDSSFVSDYCAQTADREGNPFGPGSWWNVSISHSPLKAQVALPLEGELPPVPLHQQAVFLSGYLPLHPVAALHLEGSGSRWPSLRGNTPFTADTAMGYNVGRTDYKSFRHFIFGKRRGSSPPPQTRGWWRQGCPPGCRW